MKFKTGMILFGYSVVKTARILEMSETQVYRLAEGLCKRPTKKVMDKIRKKFFGLVTLDDFYDYVPDLLAEHLKSEGKYHIVWENSPQPMLEMR